MNKFKLGQRVKIIRTGKVGKIIMIDNDDFDKKGCSRICYRVSIEGGDRHWFTVHDLELEILDEKGKEYLSNVIRPFRDKVTFIKKKDYNTKEFIMINIENDTPINFPLFEKGTMYKGMESDKKYTLSELGLED